MVFNIVTWEKYRKVYFIFFILLFLGMIVIKNSYIHKICILDFINIGFTICKTYIIILMSKGQTIRFGYKFVFFFILGIVNY